MTRPRHPSPGPNPATEREYVVRIRRVLEHIEHHLDDELGLGSLAAVACFSPYHFHRVFRGIVGEPLKQYVRRLRLERAAHRLRHGSRSVTNIAFEAGYETHESFTRAFSRRFGCAPSDFRAEERALPTTRAGTFSPMTLEDHPLSVDVRSHDERLAACLRHVGPYDEVGATWERLCDAVGEQGGFDQHTRMFAACYDDPDVTAADKIRYDACVTVDRAFRATGDIRLRTFPAGRFAVTLHEGPYARLGETYAALFGRWFASVRHEPAAPPALEFYLNDPNDTPEQDLLTEIWARID